jgi:hypothetical protein
MQPFLATCYGMPGLYLVGGNVLNADVSFHGCADTAGN